MNQSIKCRQHVSEPFGPQDHVVLQSKLSCAAACFRLVGRLYQQLARCDGIFSIVSGTQTTACLVELYQAKFKRTRADDIDATLTVQLRRGSHVTLRSTANDHAAPADQTPYLGLLADPLWHKPRIWVGRTQCELSRDPYLSTTWQSTIRDSLD